MEQQKRIAIGCDHTAGAFKGALAGFLEELGYEPVDCGCEEGCESVDYPDVAVEVCKRITSGDCKMGVLICGTGIGMSMAANKLPGIRAALCENYYSAKYTRLHNDANVICFGARTMGVELAKELLQVFVESSFLGGRHQRRIAKIDSLASSVLKG